MSFRNRKRRDSSVKGKTRDEYIDGEVLNQIWHAHINVEGGCYVDYWLLADTMFPVMSRYLKYNSIWFGVDQNYTKASIRKLQNGKYCDTIICRTGFVAPQSICNLSIWNKHVNLLYRNSHYMNVKEYIYLNK